LDTRDQANAMIAKLRFVMGVVSVRLQRLRQAWCVALAHNSPVECVGRKG
jgi:hypothetical protein